MNLANRITLSRIFLVPAFVAALLYYNPERNFLRYAAIAIFLAACISDALDGFVARKFNEKTQLGSYIDPIADKLLLISGFVCLSLMPHLPDAMRMPAWVTIVIISRDVVIVIGSIIIFFTTGALTPKPIFVGKITTVFQMAALFFSLIMAPENIRLFFYISSAMFTAWSGFRYVTMGGRMLKEV